MCLGLILSPIKPKNPISKYFKIFNLLIQNLILAFEPRFLFFWIQTLHIYVLKGCYNETPQKVPRTGVLPRPLPFPPELIIDSEGPYRQRLLLTRRQI